jgi:hypothetical protein
MSIVRGFGVVAAFVLAACGTSATITRGDGMSVEGWIRGGTADAVIVDSRVGPRREIPRSEIAEIDHPGNVHLLVGGITLGYGGLIVAAGASQCGEMDGVDCAALFVPAVVGAAIAAWGLVTWTGSKDAAADRSMRRLPAKKPPPTAAVPPTEPAPSDAAPPPSVLPPPGDASSPPAVLPPLPQKPVPAPSGEPPASEAPPEPPPRSPSPSPSEEPPGVTW